MWMDLYGMYTHGGSMTVMLDAGGLLAYVRTVPIGYGESSCNNYDDGTLSLSSYPSILAEFNYYMGPEDATSHPPSAWVGRTWMEQHGRQGVYHHWVGTVFGLVPGVRFR
jgi:hypothetical protein